MGLFSKKEKTTGSTEQTSATLTDGTAVTIATHVDCIGDSCPRPQIMTKKALGAASANDIIEVAVDNPTSMEALPPMCSQLSSTHLETIAVDRGWHVYIQKN